MAQSITVLPSQPIKVDNKTIVKDLDGTLKLSDYIKNLVFYNLSK